MTAVSSGLSIQTFLSKISIQENNIYYMATIKRFNQYFSHDAMAEYVANSLLSVSEGIGGINTNANSKIEEYRGEFQKIKDDLGLNSRLIPTFGFGIGGFYPIVESIMRLEGFQISKRSVVLLTLAAISILIIGDGKKKQSKNSAEDAERAKVIEDINVKVLQELNQTVSPNCSTGESPILKKAVSIIKQFYHSFWSKIFKGELKKTLSGARSGIKSAWESAKHGFNQTAGGLIDMLAYTAMLIPVMNVLDNAINNFPDLFKTAQILPENLLAFAAGVGVVVAKHGIAKIISRFGDAEDEQDIMDEIETPIIQKIASYRDFDSEAEPPLIKEEP